MNGQDSISSLPFLHILSTILPHLRSISLVAGHLQCCQLAWLRQHSIKPLSSSLHQCSKKSICDCRLKLMWHAHLRERGSPTSSHICVLFEKWHQTLKACFWRFNINIQIEGENETVFSTLPLLEVAVDASLHLLMFKFLLENVSKILKRKQAYVAGSSRIYFLLFCYDNEMSKARYFILERGEGDYLAHSSRDPWAWWIPLLLISTLEGSSRRYRML